MKAVTAAHCGGGALSSYTVLAGTTDRTVTSCTTCALRSLTAFTRHAGFVNDGNQGYPNDIATLAFSTITTNGNTQFIAMASSGDFAGQSCQITGWGRTSATSAIPITLQVGTMTVMTNAACASAWSSTQINSGHVCVQSSSVSACSGDSGGPLECGNQLVGATSWGQSQCSPSFPSVYTRITFFLSWINAN
jgi:secreted trypsin-like serine protease